MIQSTRYATAGGVFSSRLSSGLLVVVASGVALARRLLPSPMHLLAHFLEGQCEQLLFGVPLLAPIGLGQDQGLLQATNGIVLPNGNAFLQALHRSFGEKFNSRIL